MSSQQQTVKSLERVTRRALLIGEERDDYSKEMRFRGAERSEGQEGKEKTQSRSQGEKGEEAQEDLRLRFFPLRQGGIDFRLACQWKTNPACSFQAQILAHHSAGSYSNPPPDILQAVFLLVAWKSEPQGTGGLRIYPPSGVVNWPDE